MTLTFENEQDFDLGFDPEEVAAAVINGVLDQEACPYEAEVELILTDPENIRTMNREHRNIDRETDVLSFPMMSISPFRMSVRCVREWKTVVTNRSSVKSAQRKNVTG